MAALTFYIAQVIELKTTAYVPLHLPSGNGNHCAALALIWETRGPKSGQSKFVKLPKRQWRYFVIEFSGGNQEVELLERALSAAPCSLDVGFILSVASLRGSKLPVCLYHPPRLFQSLSAMGYSAGSASGLTKSLTKSDAEQVRKIYSKLAKHDNRILDLDKVFKGYRARRRRWEDARWYEG
jgi:hypothetical protein